MRGEGIERLVIEGGHHLGERRRRRPRDRIGGACDLGPPDLLRAGLEPARESLPDNRELLRGPGYINRLRLHMEPAIADHPGANRKTTTVFIADVYRHGPLRPARHGPERLECFA